MMTGTKDFSWPLSQLEPNKPLDSVQIAAIKRKIVREQPKAKKPGPVARQLLKDLSEMTVDQAVIFYYPRLVMESALRTHRHKPELLHKKFTTRKTTTGFTIVRRYA